MKNMNLCYRCQIRNISYQIRPGLTPSPLWGEGWGEGWF